MQPQDTTRTIPLSQGYEAIVDADDYEWLSQYKWHVTEPSPGYVYAVGWIKIKGENVKVRMHRMITNAPQGMVVDHINHDTLDNTRKNLRVVTHRDNVINSERVGGNNEYGYIGVTRDVSGRQKQWRARIRTDGKDIYLGRYLTAQEAAEAYDDAAYKYHGEYAALNFPRKTWSPSRTIPFLWTRVNGW